MGVNKARHDVHAFGSDFVAAGFQLGPSAWRYGFPWVADGVNAGNSILFNHNVYRPDRGCQGAIDERGSSDDELVPRAFALLTVGGLCRCCLLGFGDLRKA